MMETNYKKCGNKEQILFSKEISLNGKRCVLVRNGQLELLFNIDNAMDIVWANYKGVNLSFLSKNGLNDGKRDFTGNFEGGFLYTCGMDNVSSCVEGKPIHGSLHYQNAENFHCRIIGEEIHLFGQVPERALFGKNILLCRNYVISENSLTIEDTVKNEGYCDADYVLLYHFNYGYPFLDECLEINMPVEKSEPLTDISKAREKDAFKITAPADCGVEDVFYHTLAKGEVCLKNSEKHILVAMLYDIEDFPITLQWKSMISGDYALGIEPSLTRFDRFEMRRIEPLSSKRYRIEINFKEGD